MKLTFASLAALCALPALALEAQPLTGEPQIVSGTFSESDLVVQPIAIWLERGDAMITPAANEAGALLAIPAQTPSAQVCLLLNASGASLIGVNFRFKLTRLGETSSVESLDWELAGLPIRLITESENRWQIEYHTTQAGWVPLLAEGGEEIGTSWHSLYLESSASRHDLRLRWDEREPSPWFVGSITMPVLIVAGGEQTGVSLDDMSTRLASSSGDMPSETSATRAAALREEIADALKELVRETGVKRSQLLRWHTATPRISAPHGARSARRLEVLTPLEEKKIEASRP